MKTSLEGKDVIMLLVSVLLTAIFIVVKHIYA